MLGVGLALTSLPALGLGEVSGAALMLAAESQGLAFSFTDDFFHFSTGHYGSARVKDTSTPANNYNSHPFGLLSYAGASPKLCRGPNGNLRYGAHNLILQSEDFTTTWSTPGAASTVIANQAVAPDGTLTADLLYPLSSGSARQVTQTISVVAGVTYVFEIRVKAAGKTWCRPTFDSSAFSFSSASFDLVNGVVGAFNTESANIEALGDGWYKLTMTDTATSSGSSPFMIAVTDADNVYTVTANGTDGIYLWGAHIRRFPSDPTYLKTTDSAVYELPYEWGVNEFVNPSSPETQVISVDDESSYTVVVEGSGSVTLSGAATGTVAADLARTFKMDGTSLTVTVNGSPTFVHVRKALGIRVEEQRTNLLTYSEQFDNAAWTKNNSTVTANATSAPDGETTADKLVEAAATNFHSVAKTASVSAITYTYSCFMKAAERTWGALGVNGGGFADQLCYFDLSNGVAGTVGASGTASVEDYGNGWYRCSWSFTFSSATTVSFRIYTATADNSGNYAGDGSSGIYIWGAQLEEGSFPTSYIQTAGSTVTRAADNISLATSKFPLNANAGTIIGKYIVRGLNSNGNALFNLWADASNRITILTNQNDSSILTPQLVVNDAGVIQVNITATGDISVDLETIDGTAWAANDFAVVRDGGTVATDTSGSIPTVNELIIGQYNSGRYLNGHLRSLLYLPRRMTDTELQTLTGA